MEIVSSRYGENIGGIGRSLPSLLSPSTSAGNIIAAGNETTSTTDNDSADSSSRTSSAAAVMIDHYNDDELSNLSATQQFIDRYDSLPSNVDVADVFRQISSVLTDASIASDKKQAVARLLYEILPRVEEDLLDEIVRISNVLPALTGNLGSSVPAIRKASLDALVAYVKCSSEPERILRFVITQGIDLTPSSSASIVHCIRSVPIILDAIKTYSSSTLSSSTKANIVISNSGTGNGGVSHSAMVYVVTTLSKKMVQITHQEEVVRTLYEVKRVVGESKFDHFLETYYPQVKRDFDMFCEVYNLVGDDSSNHYSELTMEPKIESSDENDNDELVRYYDGNNNSDDNDKELLLHDDDEEEISDQLTLVARVELEREMEQNAVIGESDEYETELVRNSDAMNSSDDDVIMKIYDEDGNEIRRTSSRRRVTFGGEVVKIRTPDSDATVTSRSVTTGFNSTTTTSSSSRDKVDITANIVIQISNNEADDNQQSPRSSWRRTIGNGYGGNDEIKRNNLSSYRRRSRSSHIPLPIKPALHRPKDRRQQSFRQPSTTSLDAAAASDKQQTLRRYIEYEELSEIPNYDGDSFTTTSSSDSSDQHYKGRSGGGSDGSSVTGSPSSYADYASKEKVLINNTLIDLTKLGITDSVVLENLFRKNDWHLYMRGLNRLAVTLRQPEVIQNLSSSAKDTSVGISLLCYLMNSLLETKASQRIAISLLRALKGLCSALQANILVPYLISLVPIICKHLSPSYGDAVRLEATETMKILMQNLSPSPIINVLFTEQCFFSRSSKMRENSLLCLMYALMTFPSTEFNRANLTDILIKHATKEPKRRVRQAVLDTLSILAQFLPRSQFKVEDYLDPDVVAFKQALRARLNRRQLPVISSDGLILYAFQVSPSTAFGNDIEWILNGRGSLSLNCCKSQGPIHYITEDTTPLATKNSNWVVQSNNKMAVNGSASTLHYPVTNYSSDAYDEDNYTYIEKDYPINLNKDYVDNGYTPEYVDPTFQFSTLYGFPRLNTSPYEPMTDKVIEAQESNIVYHPKSRLPVRHVPVEYKSPTRQRSQDFKVTFPILTGSSPKKKMNDQINYYIQQASPQKMRNGRESSFQSYQSSDRFRNDEKNTEIARKTPALLTEISASNESVASVHSAKSNEGNSDTNKVDEDDNPFSLVPVLFPLSILEENEDDNTISEKLDELKANNAGPDEQQTLIKPRKYLERKPGVKLKRSLTKEIKVPQSSFCINPETLPPFEAPKDALYRTLQQMESSDWETVIQGLHGVVRLSKHHSKQLAPSLHSYICAVSKHVRSLRSQVARAACLSAESIFNYMSRISDQDIEEIASALFSRTADTNKFIREDSNKALDTMFDNVRLSKCVVNIFQKLSGHPNVPVRSSASRLLSRLIKLHGASEVIALTKDNRDTLLKTAAKFLVDANLETRNHAKELFTVLTRDKRILTILSEIMPANFMSAINKCLSRIARPKR